VTDNYNFLAFKCQRVLTHLRPRTNSHHESRIPASLLRDDGTSSLFADDCTFRLYAAVELKGLRWMCTIWPNCQN